MVSSDTTRMLVLGSAQLFEPANGYQLRRELLSWDVESWAHVNPGSIYSMLTTLTKQGMLKRNDLAEPGTRPVAVYRTTPAGRQELLDLVGEAITTPLHFDQTGFYTALSLMVTLFDRKQVIELLEQRAVRLAEQAAGIREKTRQLQDAPGTPPHVGRVIDLSSSLADAEHAWVESFIAQLRAGDMVFLGEPAMADWKPADDDPAWKMIREREHYLAQLAEADD